MKNTIIHLLGFPGTGKYTIAKELLLLDRFTVLDNHLINNPVFSLIDPDGETKLPARVWDNTRKIWDVVMDTMVHLSAPDKNFILTNALIEGDDGDLKFYKKIVSMSRERNSIYVPVRLICSGQELEKRIVSPERATRLKETSIKNARYNSGNRTVLQADHPYVMTLDTTGLSAREAAAKIHAYCQGLKAS